MTTEKWLVVLWLGVTTAFVAGYFLSRVLNRETGTYIRGRTYQPETLDFTRRRLGS